VHVQRAGNEDLARLEIAGDKAAFRYYARCERGPGAGCYMTLPVEISQRFSGPSSLGDLRLTARVVAAAGGPVAESAPIRVAWANVRLSGGLYYWTTISALPNYKPAPGQITGTGIMRYDFDGNASRPELVYSDQGTPPEFSGSPPAQDYSQCIGCHAITPDGKTMALTIGGSAPSNLGLLDIASKRLLELDPAAAPAGATGVEGLKRYRKVDTATFTAFGPRGDVMVNMYRGQLTLRAVDASLAVQGPILAGVTEMKTDPFWSFDGRFFAFTSFADPAQSRHQYNPMGTNGDMKVGGQIWVATADATSVRDDARLVVPRKAGVTSYYPALSHDGRLLAFNQSQCAPGIDVTKTASEYGNLRCDGYDDSSASLWLTTPAGGEPVRLGRANGGEGLSNSWPRFSPDAGTFRGKRLYWLAFSSRRPYGLQVNGGAPAATKPQLWFAAVAVDDGALAGDPSHAPVWLPNQNRIRPRPSATTPRSG
jgi:hypothetical protein